MIISAIFSCDIWQNELKLLLTVLDPDHVGFIEPEVAFDRSLFIVFRGVVHLINSH
jgi:hypothetical protein